MTINNYIKVFRIRKFVSDADLDETGDPVGIGTARTREMAVESYFFFDDRNLESMRVAEESAYKMVVSYGEKGWTARACEWKPFVDVSGLGGFPVIGEFPDVDAAADEVS
jgi:hypothetical protein